MSAISKSNEQQALLSSTKVVKSKLERLERRKQGMLRKAKSCENMFPASRAITEAERQSFKRNRCRLRRVNTTPAVEDRWMSQKFRRQVSEDVAPSNILRKPSSYAGVDEQSSERDAIASPSQRTVACPITTESLPKERRPGISRWDAEANNSVHKDITPTLLLRRPIDFNNAKRVPRRARSLQPPKLPCMDHSVLTPPLRINSFPSVA